MRLLHLANFHSTNIGNGALINGTERVLREDLGDVTFVSEPWDDYTVLGRPFDARFVRRVNETDGLLVGAAVAMNGRAVFRHAGMRLDLPIELWDRVTTPVIFYGISSRVWPNQPYHHLDRFRRTMEHVLSRPDVLFSVRNDGTKAWMASVLGDVADRITAIPDPALYVSPTESWHPELAEGKVNVVLALNNEDEVFRFGGRWRVLPNWQVRKRRFLRALARALGRVAKAWDLNLILCPHTFDDTKIIHELVSRCSPRLAYQLMVSGSLLHASRAAYFYDLYAKADLILSMRIHSMSPAIGLGTPCVPIVSQARVSAFLADVGLKDLAVDAFTPDLDERLVERVTHCLGHRDEVRARCRQVVAAMRQRSRAFHERITSRYAAHEPASALPAAMIGG